MLMVCGVALHARSRTLPPPWPRRNPETCPCSAWSYTCPGHFVCL